MKNNRPSLRHIVALLGACLLALICAAAGAAQSADDDVARRLSMDSETAPVRLDGRELFRVRGTALVPSAKRAGLISERLEQFAADESIPLDALRIEDEAELTRIVAGDLPLMAELALRGKFLLLPEVLMYRRMGHQTFSRDLRGRDREEFYGKDSAAHPARSRTRLRSPGSLRWRRSFRDCLSK